MAIKMIKNIYFQYSQGKNKNKLNLTGAHNLTSREWMGSRYISITWLAPGVEIDFCRCISIFTGFTISIEKMFTYWHTDILTYWQWSFHKISFRLKADVQKWSICSFDRYDAACTKSTFTSFSFWDLKVLIASSGMPNPNHVKLYHQFVALIYMYLHAKNQLYTSNSFWDIKV